MRDAAEAAVTDIFNGVKNAKPVTSGVASRDSADNASYFEGRRRGVGPEHRLMASTSRDAHYRLFFGNNVIVAARYLSSPAFTTESGITGARRYAGRLLLYRALTTVCHIGSSPRRRLPAAGEPGTGGAWRLILEGGVMNTTADE